MSTDDGAKNSDKALGLNAPICRRDFLNAALLTSGGLLLKGACPVDLLAQGENWGGYTGVGDYADSNGNTMQVMLGDHAVRDGNFDSLPAGTIDTGEVFDLVIVGGGTSGLVAALMYRSQTRSARSCLILDNHPIFGGEAKRNEFIVDGQRLIGPQGANQYMPPNPGGLVDWFYQQVGFEWKIKYQSWSGPSPELPLSRASYQYFFSMPSTFGFYFGAKYGHKPGLWVVDPWGKNLEGTPFPASVRSELLRWRKGDGPRREEPTFDYVGDEKSRHLDTITLEDYMMENEGLSRETIRTFLAAYEAQGQGVGPDAVSAFSQFTWPRWPRELNGRPVKLRSYPGGMTGLIRHIVKTLIPESIEGPHTLEAICRNQVNFAALDSPTSPVRMRLGSTVVQVEHQRAPAFSDFVWVAYARGGKVYRLKARAVVMASGENINKYVVRDLPVSYREAMDQFHYSACIVANVAVHNWRFLYKLGISGGRWFGGSFGNWTEVRRIALFGSDSKTIGPDSPTVLTLYMPLFYPGLPTVEQGNKGRLELLSTSFRDYERRIREQFEEMFSGSGFDLQRDIAGIILNRWGHAFVNPQPGFYFGEDGKPAPRDVLRNKPFGRIAFANVDLMGTPDHVQCIREAHRAVGQLLEFLD